MRKKLNIISTIVLIFLFLVGLSVMLYPTVSDWWNARVQSRAISNYSEQVAQIDNDTYEKLLEEARNYNVQLSQIYAPFINYDAVPGYEDILDISGTGIIGYISIPQISVELPIYHGTSDSVLNIAAGHMQGSSFPVGGESTHAVISAHRGLPSAKLFTNIDKLAVGDVFTITVLDEVLTYEVEEILIVLPNETDKLAIVSGKDYVTLMTCTPYGVNTHRLLIRSHRIDTVYEKQEVRVSADAIQVDPLLVVPLIAAVPLCLLLLAWLVGSKRKNHNKLDDNNYRYLFDLHKGGD